MVMPIDPIGVIGMEFKYCLWWTINPNSIFDNVYWLDNSFKFSDFYLCWPAIANGHIKKHYEVKQHTTTSPSPWFA